MGVPLLNFRVTLPHYLFDYRSYLRNLWSKRANQVIAGIFASFFSIGILLAGAAPAIPTSPLMIDFYKSIFFISLAVLASMIAYLVAQFIDIRIYHFWKNLTQGKPLARNNFSTCFSNY